MLEPPVIESEGGPLILIPEEWAASWRGTLAPAGVAAPPGWTWGTPGGPTTDYDRACDHRVREVAVGGADFVATVPVDDGHALVVDGGASLAFVPLDRGGVLVRASGLTNTQIEEAAAAATWEATGHTWSLPSGRFVAFTAAQPFAAASPVLRGELPPGRFAIDGVETRHADRWITLFRLRPGDAR